MNVGDTPNPTLRACTPKTWCCTGYYDNDEDCCKNDFNLTSRGVGKIERILVNPEDANLLDPSSSTAPPSNSPSNAPGNSDSDHTCQVPSESSTNGTSQDGNTSGSTNSTAAAITGGVLGTLLLGVSVALAMVFIQNRRLKKRLLTSQGEGQNTASAAAAASGSPFEGIYEGNYKYYQQQQHLSPRSGSATVAEVADPHYGTSPPTWVPTELPVSHGRGQLEG